MAAMRTDVCSSESAEEQRGQIMDCFSKGIRRIKNVAWVCARTVYASVFGSGR